MLRRVVCVVVGFLLPVLPAFGQGGVSEVNGSVTDQTGSVLPGVTITLTEESTGLQRTVVTNETGRFVIAAVTPGRYTVQGELTGFQTQTRTGVTVLVGQAVTFNLSLSVGGLTDVVTVTGDAPLIEVTTTELGKNVSATEIENLPMQGREQYALLQLVPGLTPSLTAGSFDGAVYNANGRDAGSNQFMLDGQSNKDDRTMALPQARVTVDSMSEFQVLTHEYGAEYGGSTGVIINAITKSGTNDFHGRTFYYYQDEKLNAQNYFLLGKPKPDNGSKQGGLNIGGPILRNKAFFFFNYEKTVLNSAINVQFPQEAAPLAVSYSTSYDVNLSNYFGRVDYQATPSNLVNFRVVYGPNDGIGENAEIERTTRDGFRYERAPGELLWTGQWNWVIGNNKVNEFKVGSTREDLWIGDRRTFSDGFDSIPFDIETGGWPGLANAGVSDALDLGAAQVHPDYTAGPRIAQSGAKLAINSFNEQFTWTPSSHTLKFGFGYSDNEGTFIQANNQIGTYTFGGNRPFDPAILTTYPIRFQATVGNMRFPINDKRTQAFVSDKWAITDQLTLNLGVRHDYSDMTPQKDAWQPRLGAVYALNPKTAFRAAFGKFYEFASTAVLQNLEAGRVISTTTNFDTGQDLAAESGRLPAHPCLQPTGNAGMAVISPACRAMLLSARAGLEAGVFINPEPLLPGNRKIGFLYQYNFGVEREILANTAVTVDFVQSYGRDQTDRIDINEPRLLANGTIGRPGPAVFDPDGTRIPAQARSTNFRRVLEYVTSPLFDNDYRAVEMSVDRRFANRWSGRASWTIARARDVSAAAVGNAAIVDRRVGDDLNPRSDYGLTSYNNTHAVTAGGNWSAWRGLGLGATFRYYSGNPVNEIVGVDRNNDGDANFDRPMKGRDDLTLPIQSEVDANGVALRNNLEGSDKMLLDLRLQYVHTLPAAHTIGFFWEIYNATNRVNFDNPIGNRRSTDFLRSVVADDPRSMQVGFRYTF
jgi:Carboxypeptidase regulatory-like domain/TonB dependent receptor-like, beta-barrel